jgi:hypothetical protein
MPSSEMISELEGWHRRCRMKLWHPRNISKTCEGLCCHDILVVEPPYIAEAKVRAKDCLRVGFFVSMVSSTGRGCWWISWISGMGICGGARGLSICSGGCGWGSGCLHACSSGGSWRCSCWRRISVVCQSSTSLALSLSMNCLLASAH